MNHSTGKNALKRQKAEAYIQMKIAQLNAGEALPPIRQMIAESGIGRNVLENCIARLAALKILETRDRSGIYLSDCSGEQDERIIDVIACSEIGYMSADPNTYARELVNMLLRQSAPNGYASRLLRVSYYAPLEEYRELIRRYKIRNAMLIMPHCCEIGRIFEAENVKHIVVLPRYYPSQGPAVIDAPGMVTRMMQYLYEHGHRRIGLMHTVDLGFLSLTALLRREEYYRFMSERNLRVLPDWVVHYSTDEKVLFPRLDAMFGSSEPPTALVTFDWILKYVYDYCKQKSIAVGRDFSIIAASGQEPAGFVPVPAAVMNSVRDTVELAWKLFLESGTTGNGSIDYVDLRTFEGESVARLPAGTGKRASGLPARC